MLTADIREDSEFSGVSRTRVACHMKEMGLKCRTVKKFVVTTDSKHNKPVAESFFHTIKTQMIHHSKFQNIAEAEQAIFNYIEVYYNRRRKHSTNGYKSPTQYELEWWYNRKAA